MRARVMIGLMVLAAACGQASPPSDVARARCEERVENLYVCRTPGIDNDEVAVREKGEFDFTALRGPVYVSRELISGHEGLHFGPRENSSALGFTGPLGALDEVSAGWRGARVEAKGNSYSNVSITLVRRGRSTSFSGRLAELDAGGRVGLLVSVYERAQPGWGLPSAVTQELPPLPLCRHEEAEEIVRDLGGRPTVSRCRKEGATSSRLQIDYDPRGLPLRIEENRGDKPPVTVLPTLTSLPGPRAHAPVPARTRTIVMRWSADGWLEHVHVELGGRRYGMAVDLGPTSIRLGSYFDDVQVGIWVETDADGVAARAVDHGPAGEQALPIPVVKRAI